MTVLVVDMLDGHPFRGCIGVSLPLGQGVFPSKAVHLGMMLRRSAR